MKIKLLYLCGFLALSFTKALVAQATTGTWQETVQQARGQTLYFNAWGGSPAINDYLRWAAAESQRLYGITIKHVKVKDIAQVTTRLLAEKRAGRTTKGSVDLVWINGENFKFLKQNQLLYGPFTQRLPNFAKVDFANKISVTNDFTEPTQGLEAPWGMAKLLFMYDSAKLKKNPRNARELLMVLSAYPGRFTYPKPPNFHGTTFLKQILLEITPNPAAAPLFKPVTAAAFEKLAAPLWNYLDRLHPRLWRQGEVFPKTVNNTYELLDSGEVYLSYSFNPNEAANLVKREELPPSIRSYSHEKGTLGNAHFLAIPFNANAKAGALVFINFLLSPAAQARKADRTIWGDPTVLALSKLSREERKQFSEGAAAKDQANQAALPEAQWGPWLLEPHSSWTVALEKEWERRYGK